MAEAPAILVISRDADAYAHALDDLRRAGAAIDAHPGAAQARAAYAGQEVVLGEPDCVAEALPQLPAVRWVQSTWAGVTPLLPAARQGIAVTGVRDVFGPQMAEYCLGYMLAHTLGLVERLERQRAREWFEQDTGMLRGRTLGVMGTGSIGAYIAARAADLGMRVIGYSRGGAPREPFTRVYPAAALGEFLAGLDFLVAVLPATPATDRLLDRAALARLPARAVFINVGRGNVVDEDALAEALERGELAGAVLDVFHTEPLPPDHRFWSTPRLLLTGHVAARSYPEDIAAIFLDNYARYTGGHPLRYRVDPERGY